MTRLDNWQTNLSDAIRRRMVEPFDRSLVNFNCLMWALEGAEAVTGQDFYAPFRGKFKTPKGALRTLKRTGKADTSAQYLEAIFGEQRPIVFARKGDIVVADPSQSAVSLPNDAALFGPAVGVCYGSLSYFVGEAGLVAVETLHLGPASYGLHC